MASSQKANLNKGVVKVGRKPHAGFLAMFGKSFKPTKKPTTTVSNKSATSSTPASGTAGADPAVAALKSSLAEENAKKAENT
jgi:RNA polymerase II elongation factor ELL